MIRSHLALAGSLVGAILLTPTPSASAPSGPVPGKSPRIIGYFTQWGASERGYLVKNVARSGAALRLTHIQYAFADVSPSLKCVSSDPVADFGRAYSAEESVDGVADRPSAPVKGNFGQLAKLKKRYPSLAVLISIGGWTRSANFSDAALPQNRAAFVSSCVDMFIKGQFEEGKVLPGVFDGIDIDWEYPGACGNTCKFRPEDKENYTGLIAEFRRQLDVLKARTGKRYLLSLATSASPANIANLELAKVHHNVDWISVMTYDFHGSWENVTNLLAPLFGVRTDPTFASGLWADHAIGLYLAAGVPPSKLVLGIPFYGRGWTGVAPGPRKDGLYQTATGPAPGKYEPGADDYKVLVARKDKFKRHFHIVARTATMYDGNEFWTYDDPVSVLSKTNYIMYKGLSGAMFWELSGDTPTIDLLSTLYRGLHAGAPGVAPAAPAPSAPKPSVRSGHP